MGPESSGGNPLYVQLSPGVRAPSLFRWAAITALDVGPERQTPFMTHKSKKSETLQVRLPHGMKRDFMERCEQENRAASDVIRGFMEGYLARPVEFLTSETAVMIRRTFVYPALAAAALIGAVVVLAPGTSRATGVREDFATMDADGDGLLTVWEFKRPEDGVTYSINRTPSPAGQPKTRITRGGLTETLSKLDINGDGKLDYAEYRTMRLGAAMATIMRGDRDADRRLTREEYVAGVTFSDDVVDQIKAQHPHTPIRAFVSMARKNAAMRFKRLDANRDGVVTQAELAPL